ncbi:MAG: hypothetical protein MJE77_32910 [Proteobacteria bacterium]|nr:hypothetical protein [Pseudomonadota bacterium]
MTTALERTPIDPSRLSQAAQRALIPGPAKMMAARGLAPLPHPGELISVLYQLTLDPEPELARSADKSARELPDRILEGALADASVDPRVLDFFAEVVQGRAELVQHIILNPAVADQTIASLCQRASASDIDLIAQNEERLLRHPEIIGAMFNNREARMSTVDRAIELAVRNGITVPGIPSWDAMVNAIMGGGREQDSKAPAEKSDELFARATRDAEEQPSSPESDSKTPISQMTVPQKIRLATLGSLTARSVLIRDPNRVVALTAIKAPGVSDIEAGKYAGNHSLTDDVIKYIASRRDWTKSYGVKLSLVQNPKTPIPAAIRLMPHIREKDLRSIARSKGIPSAVVAQARKLLMQRTRQPGGKK